MSDVNTLQLQEIEVEPTQAICSATLELMQTIAEQFLTFTVRSERIRLLISTRLVLAQLLRPWRGVEEPRLAGEGFDLMRTEVVNPATSKTGLL